MRRSKKVATRGFGKRCSNLVAWARVKTNYNFTSAVPYFSSIWSFMLLINLKLAHSKQSVPKLILLGTLKPGFLCSHRIWTLAHAQRIRVTAASWSDASVSCQGLSSRAGQMEIWQEREVHAEQKRVTRTSSGVIFHKLTKHPSYRQPLRQRFTVTSRFVLLC